MAGIKYKDSNGDYQLLPSMNGLSTHVHGNMSNDGKVGTESGKFLQTGANGLVVADAIKVGTVADKTLMTTTDGLVVAKTMEEAIAIWKFTNPNLFHNWDWRNPVNQRTISGTITTAGYFYDRWMLNSGSVVTNAAYLTISAGGVVEQRIEHNLLAGIVVTISVKVGATVYYGTGTFPTSAGTASVTITGWGTATLGYATGYMYVRLSPTAASNVESVKCEIGNATTLAYDPPMDYGVELAKCQRYFVNFGSYPTGTGESASTTSAFYKLACPVRMRINPTMSAINGRLLTIGGAISYTGNGAALVGANSIQIDCSASGLSADRPLSGQIMSGSNVTASADL